ncbi:hypothetical protein GOV08_01075 [Candidatus Woesearchaeota archaeon]|nr:hypothetical protein [Candidatus Woesearchaeota archaeon]
MKKTYRFVAPILIPLSAFLTSRHGFDIMNGLRPVIPHENSYEKIDKHPEIIIDKSLKNYYDQ